jgi:hypothetical protein
MVRKSCKITDYFAIVISIDVEREREGLCPYLICRVVKLLVMVETQLRHCLVT